MVGGVSSRTRQISETTDCRKELAPLLHDVGANVLSVGGLVAKSHGDVIEDDLVFCGKEDDSVGTR